MDLAALTDLALEEGFLELHALRGLMVRCVVFTEVEGPGTEGPSSRVGGRPWAPADLSWPLDAEGRPEPFWLQIDLDDLPLGLAPGLSGRLLCFASAVVHVPRGAGGGLLAGPDLPEAVRPAVSLVAHPSGRLPALESPEVAALLLDEDQEAAYPRLYARVEAEADEAVAELRLPTEDGAPGRLTLWPSPILGWDEVHQWVLPA